MSSLRRLAPLAGPALAALATPKAQAKEQSDAVAKPVCGGPGEMLTELVFANGPASFCLRDARQAPAAEVPTLERDGFELRRLDILGGRDIYDPVVVRDAVFPEVAEAIRGAMPGAVSVFPFDHIVRNAELKAEFAAKQNEADEPKFLSAVVPRMHNDYSMAAGVERGRTLLAPFAASEVALEAALTEGRVAIVNAWLPTRAVERDPLALCRWRSLAPRDVGVVRFHYRTRVGEVYRGFPAPGRQEWMWYPRMAPPEALLFKTFDSAGGDGAGGPTARFALHGAFALPEELVEAGAQARESIEVRCLVLFDERAARPGFLERPFVAPHLARIDGDASVGLSATGHEPLERKEEREPRDVW